MAEQHTEAYSNLSSLVPGGYLVCYADGGYEVIDANKYVIDLIECDGLEDLKDFSAHTVPRLLKEPSNSSMRESTWMKRGMRGGVMHADFRVPTKSGKTIAIDTFARLMRREGERPILHMFLVELERGGTIDSLTGLYGFEEFVYAANEEAERLFALGERPALIVLDLMGMKTFNANYGFEAGDAALVALADVLLRHFKADFCCRFAGDGFCVICDSKVVEHELSCAFAEYAREGVEGMPPVMAGAYTMNAGEAITTAFDRAKLALEADTRTWDSHLSWFTNEMRSEALLRVYVLAHLDAAIDEGWIRPHYEAIVRSTTGAICCESVTAAWVDPIYGELDPDFFIQVLEEAGLRHKLDLCIIDRAIADIMVRIASGKPVVPCAVNVSIGTPDLTGELVRRVDAVGLDRKYLYVELKGNKATTEVESFEREIARLHEAGFEVWLDDFGGGPATLNLLEGSELDLIKIDSTLIHGKDHAKRQIVGEGFVRSVKHLGIKTMAEMVGTRQEADEMIGIGCDLLQGCRFLLPEGAEDDKKLLDVPGALIEPVDEKRYWDTVALVNLSDLTSQWLDMGDDDALEPELPAAIVEERSGAWHVLRATDICMRMLRQRDMLGEVSSSAVVYFPFRTTPKFNDAVERSRQSGTWEIINDSYDANVGLQFYIMPLVSCDAADAYLVTSMRTSFGSALGKYGDVPAAYAVLKLVYDGDGSQPVDAEYVYANALYAEWGAYRTAGFIGRSLTEVTGDEAAFWLELCAKAVETGEGVHDVAYLRTAKHWISYNVTPSLYAGHCIIAFTLADAEERERQELIQMVMVDPLTGLKNRRGIDAEIELRLHENPEVAFVLILLDIDDFKSINDIHGHDVGDEALRKLARVLEATFPKTAVIGRNGGDEVLIVLFEDDARHVEYYLDRLYATDIVCELNDDSCALTLSAGYSWRTDKNNLMETYTEADRALYAAKFAGKHCYRAWEPGILEPSQRSLLSFMAKELADSIPVSLISHRLDGSILYVNDEFAGLLGYEGKQDLLEATDDSLESILVGSEWSRFLGLTARARTQYASGDTFETDYLARCKDGSIIKVRCRSRLSVSDSRGELFFSTMSLV